MFTKLGINKIASQYTGEYVVNYGTSFTTDVIGQALFSDKPIDRGNASSNAFFSAYLSLTVNVASKAFSASSQDGDYGSVADKAIDNAREAINSQGNSSLNRATTGYGAK